jgi:competence protein ComEC
VLHPPPADWERRKVRNDDSLTLDIRYGNVRFILPGDIGVEAENVIADMEASRTFRGLTILKVPHHGSAGSSSALFLDAFDPAMAVVSAGRGNRFGHPAPPVIAAYLTRGTPLLRTDESGAIAIVTNGRGIAGYAWNTSGWQRVNLPTSLRAPRP